ncbi:hypothetical protein HRG_001273 [Hirsutella rhossiliensis]|uniref:Uncharacterized protein n=1 Tax=Hirsutella rhossiliensis TaxID=111463 RepID=A0A9P8SPW6_9HYPO|nr:uncharacterized protein HRG_01273 [Hirsutella rhossiliensis]KAH0968631.1 hypothetical protein HRG_01273 [Hirsutella rhossiliensis]
MFDSILLTQAERTRYNALQPKIRIEGRAKARAGWGAGESETPDSAKPDAAAADAAEGWGPTQPDAWRDGAAGDFSEEEIRAAWLVPDNSKPAAATKGLRSGRVASTAPSNVLVRDAVARIRARSPKADLVHVYPWDAELANVTTADTAPPEAPDVNRLNMAMKQLALHEHRIRLHRFGQTSPGADPASLSERAKAKARGNPMAYDLFLEGLRCKTADPTTFKHRLTEFR